MPIEYLWGLVISLTVLAITTSIHAGVSAHRLKMANDEITGFISKINSLKYEYDEKISKISKLNKTEIVKLERDHLENINMAIKISIDKYDELSKRTHINKSFETRLIEQITGKSQNT